MPCYSFRKGREENFTINGTLLLVTGILKLYLYKIIAEKSVRDLMENHFDLKEKILIAAERLKMSC